MRFCILIGLLVSILLTSMVSGSVEVMEIRKDSEVSTKMNLRENSGVQSDQADITVIVDPSTSSCSYRLCRHRVTIQAQDGVCFNYSDIGYEFPEGILSRLYYMDYETKYYKRFSTNSSIGNKTGHNTTNEDKITYYQYYQPFDIIVEKRTEKELS